MFGGTKFDIARGTILACSRCADIFSFVDNVLFSAKGRSHVVISATRLSVGLPRASNAAVRVSSIAVSVASQDSIQA